jgi:uncharacterized protein (DUF2237 family)
MALDKPAEESPQRNVFGETIEPCSQRPMTGSYRTDCCHTSLARNWFALTTTPPLPQHGSC